MHFHFYEFIFVFSIFAGNNRPKYPCHYHDKTRFSYFILTAAVPCLKFLLILFIGFIIVTYVTDFTIQRDECFLLSMNTPTQFRY
jgi:hypothetical protein